MSWIEDEELTPRKKRQRGRPQENPFPSEEMEKDFCVRGSKMIELYYKPEPGKKKDFVFTKGKNMSKTLLWSIIFIYLKEEKGVKNLDGFIKKIQEEWGAKVASDRTSLCKCTGMLGRISVSRQEPGDMRYADREAYRKYRGMYEYVVQRWEEADG